MSCAGSIYSHQHSAMSTLVDQLRPVRTRYRVRWAVQQLISACILIPVVMKWPQYRWLLWVWIASASLSYLYIQVMLRRFQEQIQGMEHRIAQLAQMKAGPLPSCAEHLPECRVESIHLANETVPHDG
jgi:hypothetical protein